MQNWLKLATGALVLLVGCGAGTPSGQQLHTPLPEPSPSTEASPSPTSEPSSNIEWEDIAGPSGDAQPAQSPVCGDAPVAIGFSEISHSIKWRSLEISIMNCSDDELELEEPEIVGIDVEGVESTLSDYTRGDDEIWDMIDGDPITVAPKEHARVLMMWRQNTECDQGVQEIIVRTDGVEQKRQDCFAVDSLEASDGNQMQYSFGEASREE